MGGCRQLADIDKKFCQSHADVKTKEYRPTYRKLYKTAVWLKMSAFVMSRDPICKICGTRPSTDADHIKPHKGDPVLFYDVGNLQGACKQCHSKKTRAEQAAESTC